MKFTGFLPKFNGETKVFEEDRVEKYSRRAEDKGATDASLGIMRQAINRAERRADYNFACLRNSAGVHPVCSRKTVVR
jgi:cob(I)alamin adenosyltransferase